MIRLYAFAVGWIRLRRRSSGEQELSHEPDVQPVYMCRPNDRFAKAFAPTVLSRQHPAVAPVTQAQTGSCRGNGLSADASFYKRQRVRLASAVLFALSCTSVAHAAIDAYTFKDDAERARYAELTRELRCPKCQNQNIADSNAPIAADLRKEIYRMLGEGQSNQQIIDFMVDRYGEFVRYKPELNAHTWLLWFGPAGLLLGGVLLIGVIVARRRHPRTEEADVLSDEERRRLAHLLDNKTE